MLKLLDVVKLKNDRPDVGVTTAHIGAVVDVLGNGAAYTVEFMDERHEFIESSIETPFTESELELADETRKGVQHDTDPDSTPAQHPGQYTDC